MGYYDSHRGTFYCSDDEKDEEVLDEEYEDDYKKIKKLYSKYSVKGQMLDLSYDVIKKNIPDLKQENLDKMIIEGILEKNADNNNLKLAVNTNEKLFPKSQFEKAITEVVNYVKENKDGKTSMNDIYNILTDIRPRYISRMIEEGILQFSEDNKQISVTEKGKKEADEIKKRKIIGFLRSEVEFERQKKLKNEISKKQKDGLGESKLVTDLREKYGQNFINKLTPNYGFNHNSEKESPFKKKHNDKDKDK